ncbi:hypothetical protein D3C80_1975180 [compost metagenome]
MAGKTEQLLGQLGTAVSGIEDVLQHALGTRRVLRGLGQPGRAHDDGQQVVEVMRKAPSQLA